jgi:hypothetical protein
MQSMCLSYRSATVIFSTCTLLIHHYPFNEAIVHNIADRNVTELLEQRIIWLHSSFCDSSIEGAMHNSRLLRAQLL